LRVATIGPENRVLLKTVTIARDLGKVVEIATGLDAQDRVIETPPDGIAQGDVVRIAGAASTPSEPEEASAKHVPGKPPG